MSPMKVLLFNGSPKKNGCTATKDKSLFLDYCLTVW